MTTDGVNLRELVLDILLSVTKGEAYSHRDWWRRCSICRGLCKDKFFLSAYG